MPNTGVGQVWPRTDSWIWQHEVTPDLEKSCFTGGVRARGRNAYFIGFKRNERIGDMEYKLEFCYKGRERNGAISWRREARKYFSMFISCLE